MAVPGGVDGTSGLCGFELLEGRWEGERLLARAIFVLFVLAAGLGVEGELVSQLLLVEGVGVVFPLGGFIYYERKFSESLHLEGYNNTLGKKESSSLTPVHSAETVVQNPHQLAMGHGDVAYLG